MISLSFSHFQGLSASYIGFNEGPIFSKRIVNPVRAIGIDGGKPMQKKLSRRRFVEAAGAVSVFALAGCTDEGEEEDPEGEDPGAEEDPAEEDPAEDDMDDEDDPLDDDEDDGLEDDEDDEDDPLDDDEDDEDEDDTP